MNVEAEYREEVSDGPLCETAEVLSSLKNSPIPPVPHENETEANSGECESSVDQEKPERISTELTVDKAVVEPKDSSEDHPVNVSNNEELEVNNQEINDQPINQSQEDRVNENSEDQPTTINSETQSPASPQYEAEGGVREDEEGELDADDLSPSDDINYQEYMHLLEELCEEKEEVSRHNSQLQVKLAEYLRRKTREDLQLDREIPVSEQQQEYDRCMEVLSERKQQFADETQAVLLKTEELRLRSQENLEKVDNEWKAFMALKHHTAVAALSRCLGKTEAVAKAEATLATEQLRQDELVKLCMRHIKLKMKIHRLEVELQEVEEHGRDPLQVQYRQLQAARLEQKKQAEKENEECMKLQAKIISSLEVLTNIKEKLSWCQKEVSGKQEELAEVEATVARKRHLLTRTKKARNRLQRDNQRLKECRGLLGNMVLLQDFEKTADSCSLLEEQLEELKCRQAELVLSSGRWRKKMNTSQ